MPWWKFDSIIFAAFIFFSVMHYFSKLKHPFKRAFVSMCIGPAALVAIDLTSGLTGVYIPFSLLSILTSIIGGVPGVTTILLLNLFF